VVVLRAHVLTVACQVMLDLESYCNPPYGLEKAPEVALFLKNLPQLADKELYKLSLTIEPRGADIRDIK
jgi:hypothetical protein